MGGYLSSTTRREGGRGCFYAANIRDCVWEVISLLQHEGREEEVVFTQPT